MGLAIEPVADISIIDRVGDGLIRVFVNLRAG
jgi:hypothetical protein